MSEFELQILTNLMGVPGMHAPSWSNFFQFRAVFRKFWFNPWSSLWFLDFMQFFEEFYKNVSWSPQPTLQCSDTYEKSYDFPTPPPPNTRQFELKFLNIRCIKKKLFGLKLKARSHQAIVAIVKTMSIQTTTSISRVNSHHVIAFCRP